MINTCSIKFLPQAHIGAGIRMTKDKNTVPFDNKPMKGLTIIAYSQQGFRIEHETLPKSIWVDFDQLPLTRLKIENGVIEDEITFVENIVNHKMQLIRTLDTEYIDLIYSTKALETVKEDIIPISQAVPGQVYKGARCEHGTEMVYLGTWLTKIVKSQSSWRSKTEKFYLSKSSPKKAFFLVESDRLSYQEQNKLKHKFDVYDSRPTARYDEINHKGLTYDERYKKYEEACKELLKNTPRRYKILSYAITSKVIKDVIKTEKVNDLFYDKEYNREVIYQELNAGSNHKSKMIEYDTFNETYVKKIFPFVISNNYFGESYHYLTDTKIDLNNKATEEINKNFVLTLESCLYEDRHN